MTAATHRAPSTTGAGDDWAERLARFGLLGKAVLHAVIGVLALQLAFDGSSSSEASTTGALQWIADRPLGVPALWAVGISLAALALWRGITTFTGDPVEDDDGWYRAVWAVKALVYGALAVTAITGALDGGSTGGSSDNSQASGATSTVFDWPMGLWIVVAAGLAVIGVAVYLIFTHALGAEFAKRLRCPEDSAVVKLGRVGYGLRSIAYVLVGIFFVQAGLAGQEQRAKGLSGALERAADSSWGTLLLAAIGVGFLAYSAYCVAESRLRRDA